MEHLFGQEWEIVPAGGATGEAFFAQHDGQRLFLKRNSSPFLAVLSAEGIVPKLIWTKRLESGDVITAQQWLEGRELKPPEMNYERVAKLLHKIHCSDPLLGMLKRMGKSPLQPNYLLYSIEETLDQELLAHPIVTSSLQFLKHELANIPTDLQVVCHGDVNHNNWLLTEEDDQLYLIDWDGAMIGDPAIDLGMLLYWYIPQDKWIDWVRLYGIELTDHLRLRMKWYFVAQTLNSIQWLKDKERTEEMEKSLHFIGELLTF
ncbi:phosphotransferase family protein [Robertmurraya kyonggiensis]|uniref:Phosphotransferase n=1 Tax=Robertmurraya kyonggiensis TaxID=1037680 RepID=A0A4U1D2A0_9BACI|nr:phosphotransferase family protein [Robertmurraya kyonggiensis]TKC15863.1 phosphotransferase [Robertmurraya kyonggiensis]